MTAPRRRPSYSLGWGTLLRHPMHSYWLVILSTLLATPSRRLTLRGTILGCAETLHTRVTKIGLIDPDDPTEEGRWITRGQRQHKLHGRSIGLADAINQITFGSD